MRKYNIPLGILILCVCLVIACGHKKTQPMQFRLLCSWRWGLTFHPRLLFQHAVCILGQWQVVSLHRKTFLVSSQWHNHGIRKSNHAYTIDSFDPFMLSFMKSQRLPRHFIWCCAKQWLLTISNFGEILEHIYGKMEMLKFQLEVGMCHPFNKSLTIVVDGSPLNL